MRTYLGLPWLTASLIALGGCGGSGDGGPSNQDGGNGGADAGGGAGSDGGIAIVEAGTAGDGAVVVYGAKYEGGQFHLGPVDWEETAFHNACAPGTKYAPAIRQAEGTLLAGIWNGIPNVGGYCDACIYVTTAKGKSALLRVVTYGDTTSNSIDVSPEAYQILNGGEFPRAMTWQFAKCEGTAKIVYEFQTGANEWWTSLWVRNASVPLAKVEVKSVNHAAFIALARAGDGTLTDASGFGNGSFTIQLTGIDGQKITDTFAWPAAGIAGQTLTGQGNFQ